MLDWRVGLGLLLGVSAALVILVLFAAEARGSSQVPSGAFTPDCGGALDELVIHYTSDSAPITQPLYRDFLNALPGRVRVYVVCPSEEAFQQLCAAMPLQAHRLSPIYAAHPITCWSRDRWAALAPARPDLPLTLLMPRAEDAAEAWSARAGDQLVGETLANALGGGIVARRSPLFFDGGDFVADAHTVFVNSAVLRRNLQRTVRDRDELLKALQREFKKNVVLLEDAPDHHAGMYMMLVKNRTALVGDPSLARPLLDTHGSSLCPCGDDFGPPMQARFDNVARQCAAAGYRVVRIPTVAGSDSRTFITYVNVLLDRKDGRDVVYLPTFKNAPVLNQTAENIWRALGYEVAPVDCSGIYVHFGALRCLVSVLRREG